VTRSITVRKLDPDFFVHNFYLLVGHQYLFSLLDYVNLMRIRVQHFVLLRMRIRIQMRIHILGSSVNLMKYLLGIFCFIFYLYLLFLVSFGAPVFLSSLTHITGRCAPPPSHPSQLRCFLFHPKNKYNLANSVRPREGLSRNKMLPFSDFVDNFEIFCVSVLGS
jgi:hypothetical protein